MISMYKNASIKRLLLKTAGCIGHSAHKYFDRILSAPSGLSDIEPEIAERIVSMGFHSDDVIESACSAALERQVFNAVDFNILVCEADRSLLSQSKENICFLQDRPVVIESRPFIN